MILPTVEIKSKPVNLKSVVDAGLSAAGKKTIVQVDRPMDKKKIAIGAGIAAAVVAGIFFWKKRK